jgi:putative transposase
MIDRSHALSVTRQAELLDISRSNVYYLPKTAPPADLALILNDLPLMAMSSEP